MVFGPSREQQQCVQRYTCYQMSVSTQGPPAMAQRATIPHIFTQWEPGQFSRPACGLERIDSGKKTDDFRRPSPSTRKQYFKLDYVSPATPSGQSLMLTPESNRWAFESCRNLRKSPSELSAVDSIFELPSGDPDESPASSTHSSFVAELEDTSPVAIHSKRSAFPGSQLAFQSSAITVRHPPNDLKGFI